MKETMLVFESERPAKLNEVVYENFTQYVLDVLAAVGQPSTTIARLREHAKSHPREPIVLHTRGVFVEVPEESHPDCVDQVIRELNSEALLVFCISKHRISAQNLATAARIEFAPDDISEHYSFLLPLVYGKRADSPQVENQRLGELITVLRNKLMAKVRTTTAKQHLPFFVLDIVKLGIQRCFSNEAELNLWIRTIGLERGNSRRVGYKKLLSESRYSKSLVALSEDQIDELVDISVLDEIGRLLSFDYRVLASEVVGSLIYRIVDASDDKHSHTVSESNSVRILTPTLIEPYLQLSENESQRGVSLSSNPHTPQSLKFLDPTNGTGTILATAISSLATFIEATSRGKSLIETLEIGNFVAITDSPLGAEITRITLWLTFLNTLSSAGAMSAEVISGLYDRVTVCETDALSADWSTIFDGGGPDIIVGAPTFKGWNKMSAQDKTRFKELDSSLDPSGLDFSAAWLLKAAQIVRSTKAQACFALTNSLVQGSQVEKLWPTVLSDGVEIGSAFPSEKWRNDALQDTGVSVVVIAIRAKSKAAVTPTLRYRNQIRRVEVVGPYLIGDVTTVVKSRSRPLKIDALPSMIKGNMPYDGGNLLLSSEERRNLITAAPSAVKFIRTFVGADEFINGLERYCLWISSEDLAEANLIPEINHRITQVGLYRDGKSDPGAQRLAKRPYQFREFRSTTSQSLVVPSVSSELRKYIPIGFVGNETIVSNLCFVIYECESWLLALLSSSLHMNWIRTTCGYLETRLRYSNRLGYNTFPVPHLKEGEKLKLSELSYELTSCREEYLNKTLGELYTQMPLGLEACHAEIDRCVRGIYGLRTENDEEQLKVLMKMYSKLVSDDEV